jgi:hypothetical protein
MGVGDRDRVTGHRGEYWVGLSGKTGVVDVVWHNVTRQVGVER